MKKIFLILFLLIISFISFSQGTGYGELLPKGDTTGEALRWNAATKQWVVYPGIKFNLSNSGKIGIGTVSPTTTLDVAGSVKISSDAYLTGLAKSLTTTEVVSIDLSGKLYRMTLNDLRGGKDTIIVCDTLPPFDCDTIFTSGDEIWLRDSTNERVFLKYIGDSVGIGIVKAKHKLDVIGDARITSDVYLPGLTPSASANYVVSIDQYNKLQKVALETIGGTATSTTVVVCYYIGDTYTCTTATVTTSGFWARSPDGSLFPKTITDYVGIGTSSPTVRLEIVGETKIHTIDLLTDTTSFAIVSDNGVLKKSRFIPLGDGGTQVWNMLWELYSSPPTVSISDDQVWEIGTTNPTTITTALSSTWTQTVFKQRSLVQSLPSVSTITTWVGLPSTRTYTLSFEPRQASPSTFTQSYYAVDSVYVGNNRMKIYSDTSTIYGVYPYLFGESSSTSLLSGGSALYNAMRKHVIVKSDDTVNYYSPTDLTYFYFAYPKAYGTLNSIHDHNSNEMIWAFSKDSANVSSSGLVADWTDIPYYIYRSRDKAMTYGSWKYKFFHGTITTPAPIIPSEYASVVIESYFCNFSYVRDSIMFKASPVNGGDAPTYQWYSNSSPINGATNSTYHGAAGTDFNSGDVVYCEMTSNMPNVGSNPATSNSITIPTILPLLTGIKDTLNGVTYTYNEVGSHETGKIWLDRNVGATRVARSFGDTQAYGKMFQWGRASDGHEDYTFSDSITATPVNGYSTILASSDVAPNSLIINNSSNRWQQVNNDALWSSSDGNTLNNPCPNGYRVPTTVELTNEFSAGCQGGNNCYANSVARFFYGWENVALERWNQPTTADPGWSLNYLKLPTAGYNYIDAYSPTTFKTGEWGVYWTSDPEYAVRFLYTQYTYWEEYHRTTAMPLRCIKN